MRVRVQLLTVGATWQRGALVGLPSWKLMRFPALAAVIRHPSAGTILFDTGYGSAVVDRAGLALAVYRRLLPVELAEAERFAEAG